MDPLAGKRLVILGMARQGTVLARFAVAAGATVILSDLRPAEALQPAMDALSDLPSARLAYVLGEHPLSLLDGCDLLALSGGVAIDSPIVEEARRRGIPLTNDSLEFMRRVHCLVVGITGSAGKTTTTALLGLMGQKSGRQTWIGGNIGRPLLADLAQMQDDDLVCQELSSFQLELWQDVSPPIGAILNITPNHLDRHKTMARYTAAKSNILRHQDQSGVALLSADDPGAAALQSEVRGRLRRFSLHAPVSDGAYLADGKLWLASCDAPRVLCDERAIALRGKHNVANVLAAATLADSAGIAETAIVEAIREFRGVPHRLEIVRKLHGVQYINDSIATAPERALAALSSFDEPIILLAGGRDKDMVWDEWAREVSRRVKHIVLFGELADSLGGRLDGTLAQTRVDTLAEAVQVVHGVATDGDIVLLSPGGTSFDAYTDFAERGEHFRLLVNELE